MNIPNPNEPVPLPNMGREPRTPGPHASSSASWALAELRKNAEVQRRAREPDPIPVARLVIHDRAAMLEITPTVSHGLLLPFFAPVPEGGIVVHRDGTRIFELQPSPPGTAQIFMSDEMLALLLAEHGIDDDGGVTSDEFLGEATAVGQAILRHRPPRLGLAQYTRIDFVVEEMAVSQMRAWGMPLPAIEQVIGREVGPGRRLHVPGSKAAVAVAARAKEEQELQERLDRERAAQEERVRINTSTLLELGFDGVQWADDGLTGPPLPLAGYGAYQVGGMFVVPWRKIPHLSMPPGAVGGYSAADPATVLPGFASEMAQIRDGDDAAYQLICAARRRVFPDGDRGPISKFSRAGAELAASVIRENAPRLFHVALTARFWPQFLAALVVRGCLVSPPLAARLLRDALMDLHTGTPRPDVYSRPNPSPFGQSDRTAQYRPRKGSPPPLEYGPDYSEPLAWPSNAIPLAMIDDLVAAAASSGEVFAGELLAKTQKAKGR